MPSNQSLLRYFAVLLVLCFCGGPRASALEEAPAAASVSAPAISIVPDEPSVSAGSRSLSNASRGNFWHRFAQAYTQDWSATSSSEPAPARAGWPAPVNSPPFPFADWPYGGSPVIGAPDTNTYPLMEGLDAAKSRHKIYGWIDTGFNVSTSNRGKFANGPEAYDVVPNSIQLDQLVLYFERLPNEVQRDHFDWGYRFSNLYGMDYRYTTAKGIFSQQLLARNNTYGYDPVMVYVDLWFPHVAEGMNIRIGRYISLPDIEAQLAPNNYTYSHSLLYTVDCYTQSGAVATIKLNNRWQIQGGISGGCEAALWTHDAKPTGTACASYSWHYGGDNLYLCANAINDGKYAYNNVNAYYLTWYRKINDSWHTDTEGWYQYERDVPNIAGNVANPIPPETGANGAYCDPGQLRCYAPDWAVVNYIEKDFNHHHDSLNIRNEYVDDIRGQRTGYKTRYTEHLVGIDHWVGTTVTIRPELRLDHAYDAPAYDSGHKKTQFTAACDLIYHF